MHYLPKSCFLTLLYITLWIQPLAADNVLLIIADDLGRDSLAKFNQDPLASIPNTPNIDHLAESGILFDRAYAYSTCSPTRASILTGRYEFRTGVFSPEVNTLMPNEYTLAEAIVDSGKIGDRLAHLGKWHLGGSSDAPNTIGGWPHFAGALGGGIPDYSRWTKVTNGTTTSRYTTYATTDLVDDAVNWIESQGPEEWFLWVAFNAPHTPYHKPPSELHEYDDLSGTEEDILANPRAYYEAMVQAMDTEIGRLLDSVDMGTTTVIFIGDNGTPNSVLQEPFPRRHGKGSLYEGGINVPLIIAGSAVPIDSQNTTNSSMIQSVDLYDTILDLLKISEEELMPTQLVSDSQSFYDVLTGENSSHSRTITYTAQPGSSASTRDLAVSNDRYKWILFENGSEEFYYRTDGISEESNRIATLDVEATSALADFKQQMNLLVNTPRIYQTEYINGRFEMEIGWFANANLVLEYTETLAADTWQAIETYQLIDSGTSSLKLSHETTALRGFFRVLSQ